MPCSRTVTATGSGRSLARRARQASAHPVSSHSHPPQHVCSLCKKHFTTSGHLKRHVEIHSGSRNFPCPIPGCETRCSRADNLQQHIKTHSASYVPRKAPKRDTKRNRARGKAAAVPSPMQEDPFSFPALSVSGSPPAFDDASTWSSYSQSSAEQSPPPTTPPSFAHAFPSSLPTSISFPMDFQVEQHQPGPEIHVPGLALLSLEPAVELFRPKRLLVDTNFDAVVVASGPSPSSAASSHSRSGVTPAVELVHPIPRASQPRSPLLDLQLDDAPAMVSPSTSESDAQSLVSVGASMDMEAPGCFYPYSGASSEWPAAMHMAATQAATYDMEAYLAGLAYPASVSSASAMIHAHTGPGDPGHGLSMPLPATVTSYAYAQQQQHQFQ